MELIDNVSRLFGDDLQQTLEPGARLKIAASCFSIYAFEALKDKLESIESLQFVFTSPTFIPDKVTDKIRRERREFHIPKGERERSFYGTEFEIQLKNKLTQRAISRECAEWMRKKAKFRSNRSKAPMQQLACVQTNARDTAYMPLQGFTAVDLGYQPGDAVSNMINKFDEPLYTQSYINLFDQIWDDKDKLEDVTSRLCDHIKTVFFIDENALAPCFDEGIDEDFVKELAKRKPLRTVFRDSGFASDAVKINVEQIFKLMSPTTEVKSI